MPDKYLHQVPVAVQNLYERARASAARGNFGYATALFESVLEQEPSFYDCRAALRAAQFKEARGRPGWARRCIMVGQAAWLAVRARLVLSKDALAALRLGEAILRHDPHSLLGHRTVAWAALAGDLPRAAALSLEIIYRRARRKKDVGLRLAQAMVAEGHFRKAERIYTELEQAHPEDPVIGKAVKDFAATRAVQESGSPDPPPSDQPPGPAPVSRPLNGTATLATLGHACQPLIEKPNSSTPAAEPDRKSMAGSEASHAPIRSSRPELTIGEESALEGEALARQLSDQRQRVQKYPFDLLLRFDFGQSLLRAGRVNEAIHEFQRAQKHPHLRIKAMHQLAKCFASRRLNDLALRTLDQALREKPTFDSEKKELKYLLGSVLEQMGKREEAIAHFKDIYEVDIRFSDVASKVESYYAERASRSDTP